MTATSLLSHDGEIYVVPAHGMDPGEYVSKLGRSSCRKYRRTESGQAGRSAFPG